LWETLTKAQITTGVDGDALIIPDIMRDFAPQHPPIRVAFCVLSPVTYVIL